MAPSMSLQLRTQQAMVSLCQGFIMMSMKIFSCYELMQKEIHFGQKHLKNHYTTSGFTHYSYYLTADISLQDQHRILSHRMWMHSLQRLILPEMLCGQKLSDNQI